VRVLMDDRFQPPAFFRAQPDDVLPDPDLWHDPIRGDVDDVEAPVDFNDANPWERRERRRRACRRRRLTLG
jgi:hypothetical protein